MKVETETESWKRMDSEENVMKTENEKKFGLFNRLKEDIIEKKKQNKRKIVAVLKDGKKKENER